MAKIFNGNQPKVFAAGVIITIIGVIIFAKSEAYSGMENFSISKSLGHWGTWLIVGGVVVMVASRWVSGGVKK